MLVTSPAAMPDHPGLLSHASEAPTRTRPVPTLLGQARQLLGPTQVIASPETRLQYRIERLLGEGGFGQVYLARRLGRSMVVPGIVCIKISERIDGWLREAYFGQLLDGHPRAIRVFDTFPLLRPDGRSSTASPWSTRARATSGRSCAAPARGGRRPPRGARSRASSRCSESCTAARCSTATSLP